MNDYRSSEGSRLTHHAGARLTQRGFKQTDIAVLHSHGEHTEDGYVMSDKATEAALHALKRQQQQIERLRGTALIETRDGVIVTIYRPVARRMRRLRTA